MQLKRKALSGIVRPFHTIDRMLKSQGFSRSHNQPPVYNMKIKDVGSGMVYLLRIPTSSPDRHSDSEYLRLESPSLEMVDTSLSKQNIVPVIPDPVVSAVNEKMEEVASYLKS